MRSICLVVASVFLMVTSTAAVAGLKDKKAQKAENEAFKREIASVNKACGIKLSGTIDWKSFTKDKQKTWTKYALEAVIALMDLAE